MATEEEIRLAFITQSWVGKDDGKLTEAEKEAKKERQRVLDASFSQGCTAENDNFTSKLT